MTINELLDNMQAMVMMVDEEKLDKNEVLYMIESFREEEKTND